MLKKQNPGNLHQHSQFHRERERERLLKGISKRPLGIKRDLKAIKRDG